VLYTAHLIITQRIVGSKCDSFHIHLLSSVLLCTIKQSTRITSSLLLVCCSTRYTRDQVATT